MLAVDISKTHKGILVYNVVNKHYHNSQWESILMHEKEALEKMDLENKMASGIDSYRYATTNSAHTPYFSPKKFPFPQKKNIPLPPPPPPPPPLDPPLEAGGRGLKGPEIPRFVVVMGQISLKIDHTAVVLAYDHGTPARSAIDSSSNHTFLGRGRTNTLIGFSLETVFELRILSGSCRQVSCVAPQGIIGGTSVASMV